MPSQGLYGNFPVGSLGWCEENGRCFDCRAPATRRAVDPACSPPIPICDSCFAEWNDVRESEDGPLLMDACPECDGSGRYDDVMPCPTCDGEGVFE